MYTIRRIFTPLIVPAVLIALAATIVGKWSSVLVMIHELDEFWAFLVISPILPYVFLLGGFVIGWRYNNAGLVCTTMTLAMAYYALAHASSSAWSEAAGSRTGMVGTVMILLPLNLACQSLLTKRRVLTPAGAVAAALLFIQAVAVMLLHHNPTQAALQRGSGADWLIGGFHDSFGALSQLLSHDFLFEGRSIPTAGLLVFAVAIIFCLLRYVRTGDIRIAGTFCALISILLAFAAINPVPAVPVYFCVTGIILISTTFESSYSMAYIDELTGLPARRSLNETLLNLGRKYAIAMIDVDHFKQFNDVYGHKIGDQVLRTIALRLSNISGGAKTFRYGGEEFTAIFPGKNVREAAPHLEKFRKALENTPFAIRRKRKADGGAAPAPGATDGHEQVHVTVSIGLAALGESLPDAEKVLKAADKMLNAAKQAGRNRCCVLLPKKGASASRPLSSPAATAGAAVKAPSPR